MAFARPAKSKSKSSRSSPPHPPFYDMITDAIDTMKERGGLSQVVIRKFIEQKYRKRLPPNFRKTLLVQLKRLVASGKLVKVKNTYKVASATSLPECFMKSEGSAAAEKKAKSKAGGCRGKAKSMKSLMAKKRKRKK